MNEFKLKNIKCIVIGDSDVGKTTLCTQSTKKKLSPIQQEITPTLGVDFFIWKLGKLKLHIWDTSGNRRFNDIINSYYKNAEICLIVFNLNDKASFYALDTWYKDIEKFNINKIILIGNKSDLPLTVNQFEINSWIYNKNTPIHYLETNTKKPTDIFYQTAKIFYPSYIPLSNSVSPFTKKEKRTCTDCITM